MNPDERSRACVDELLRHVAGAAGLRADLSTEPVVIRARQRTVALLWRDTAVLEVALPPEAAGPLSGVQPRYHVGPNKLRIALRDRRDVEAAERFLDRRLHVEHNVAQYVERSP